MLFFVFLSPIIHFLLKKRVINIKIDVDGRLCQIKPNELVVTHVGNLGMVKKQMENNQCQVKHKTMH